MRPSLNPPAIIQPAATLFDWAKAEADAIEAMRTRLDEKRADLATVTAVVEESIEYGELEEARERLKAAKTAAQAARPVKAHTTIGDITFPSLSLDIGADLVSLLDLSPSLIGLPFIPKGTTVKFFGLS